MATERAERQFDTSQATANIQARKAKPNAEN